MYAPVPTTQNNNNNAVAAQPPPMPLISTRLMCQIAGLVLLGGGLGLAYNRCLTCVWGIAALSLLTLNCIPGMPVIFLMSAAVLLMHAVDLNRATLKMEIPLGDLIPSYDSVRPYVHLITATPAPPPPPAIEAYARQGLILAHAR